MQRAPGRGCRHTTASRSSCVSVAEPTGAPHERLLRRWRTRHRRRPSPAPRGQPARPGRRRPSGRSQQLGERRRGPRRDGADHARTAVRKIGRWSGISPGRGRGCSRPRATGCPRPQRRSCEMAPSSSERGAAGESRRPRDRDRSIRPRSRKVTGTERLSRSATRAVELRAPWDGHAGTSTRSTGSEATRRDDVGGEAQAGSIGPVGVVDRRSRRVDRCYDHSTSRRAATRRHAVARARGAATAGGGSGWPRAGLRAAGREPVQLRGATGRSLGTRAARRRPDARASSSQDGERRLAAHVDAEPTASRPPLAPTAR